MSLLEHSLHIFCSDIEEIRGRLSQCQFYSNTLNIRQIGQIQTKLSKATSPLGFMYQLKKSLHKKDTFVKFYSQDRQDYISVFSDFFCFEDAFNMSKCFFEDLDAIMVAISCIDCQWLVSVIFRDKEIGSVLLDRKHAERADLTSSIGAYFEQIPEMNCNVDRTLVHKVFEELKSMQALSETEVLQLLIENSQVDEFIL